MKKKILLIVNPISGIYHSENLEKIVFNTLDSQKYEVFLEYTKYKHHGRELARQGLAAEMDVIAAVGGDGTINEVASQLVGTSTTFAVVPHGSGNGLAYHLHIPINVKRALQVINNGIVQTIDTCRINQVPFFSVAGIGFDAKVAFDFNNDSTRGFQNYLKHILKNLFEYQSGEYIIQVDGSHQESEAFFITFANSSQWGYNVKIAPQASVQDGMLDVCVCSRPNLLKLLNVDLLYLLSNHVDKSSIVKYMQCQKVTIQSKNGQKMYLHIDGDAAGVVDSVEVEVIPQSLHTIIPKMI